MAKNAKQFIDEIRQLADSFRQQIEAEVDGFAPDAVASAARRARAEDDLEYFARTYFPHYIKHPQVSELQRYLYARLPQVLRTTGNRDAVAAPRGEAKTTIVAIVALCWAAVYGKERYAIIIMDALEQSLESLESIKAELEFNARLRMDFPEATGQGRVWKVGVILTALNMKIEAFGVGKRIRGRRHGPHRPGFVVLDDVENDENVRQLAQRDKLESWIDKTVVPLGGADDSINIFMIGTIIRLDSVLYRKLANPLWRTRRFQGLVKLPDRMDLWDKWEETLLNHPGEPDEKLAEARKFLDANRAEMHKGAVTSWPGVRTLESLMIRRAREGHAAFDSEIQNDPGAAEAFFKFHFWVDRLKEWVFFGACDPSLGKRGGLTGDPSAVLVGGMNRSTRVLDVIEASIRRRLPLKTIYDIIAMQREYNCVVWAFESVQFQEFMRTQLIDISVAENVPVPARAVIPHNDKDLRIESLQPFCERGLIRVHPSLKTLISEGKHYPNGEHVDGLDALQMLWMVASTSGAGAGATVADKTNRSQGRTAERRSAGRMYGART